MSKYKYIKTDYIQSYSVAPVTTTAATYTKISTATGVNAWTVKDTFTGEQIVLNIPKSHYQSVLIQGEPYGKHNIED